MKLLIDSQTLKFEMDNYFQPTVYWHMLIHTGIKVYLSILVWKWIHSRKWGPRLQTITWTSADFFKLEPWEQI